MKTDGESKRRSLFPLVCVLAALGGSLGCAESASETVPVTGKLLVNGKPAQGATVFFHPRASAIPKAGLPMGIVQEDGSFTATTYVRGDGLPAGEYDLTARWPTRQVVEGETIEGPDQFRGRYSNASNPIATVTVAEGESRLAPIELRIP